MRSSTGGTSVAVVRSYALLMTLRGSVIGIKLLLSVYLAKYANLELLGAYGLIAGLAVSVPVVAGAGVMAALGRDLIDASPDVVSSEVRSYVLWVFTVYAALLPIAIWADNGTTGPLRGHGLAIWAVVLGEHLLADSISLLNTTRRPREAGLISVAQAIAWILPFIAISALWPQWRQLDGLLLVWIAGTWSVLLLAARYVGLNSLAVWDRAWLTWLRNRLHRSNRMFLLDVLGTLGAIADRYLIAWLFSLELTGVFVLFTQVANALSTLVSSSIIPAHRPDLIVLYRKGESSAAQRLWRLRIEALGSLLLMSAIIWIAAWQVSPLLRRPLIEQQLPLLAAILFATWLRMIFQTEIIRLYATLQDTRMLALNALGLVLICSLSMIMARIIGPYAMPAAVATASIVQLILLLQDHARNAPAAFGSTSATDPGRKR